VKRIGLFLILFSIFKITTISQAAGLDFSPTSFYVDAGDTIEVAIQITDAENLAGISLVFTANSGQLQLLSSQVGDFFDGHQISLLPFYYESSGLLEIGIAALDIGFGEPGIDGDGTLVHIAFLASGCGETGLIFQESDTFYNNSDFIFYGFDQLGSAQIEIGGGGAPQFSLIPLIEFDEDGSTQVDLYDYLTDPYTPEGFHSWQIEVGSLIHAEIDTDGILSLSAPANQFGDDTATVIVANTCQLSDTTTVNIRVNSVDDPPELSDIPELTFYEDQTDSSLYLPDFVTDIDSSPEEMIWEVENSLYIHASVSSLGRLYLQPQINWSGSESLTLTVASSVDGETASSDLAVTVISVNDPPQWTAPLPDIFFNEDEPSQPIDLNGYIQDVEDDESEIEWIIANNQNLLITLEPETHQVSFVGLLNWYGEETLYFEAVDTEGASVLDTIQVTVYPINDPPAIDPELPDIAFLEDHADSSLRLDQHLLDPDIEDMQFTWQVTGHAHIQVEILSNDQVVFTSELNWSGSEEVVFTLSDPAGETDSQPIMVTVTAVDDPFVLLNIPNVTFPEDSLLVPYDLDDYIFDPDNEDPEITWSVSNHPWIFAEIDADNRVAYSALPDRHGEDYLLISADDGQGTIKTDSILVTVLPRNDAPTQFDLLTPLDQDTLHTNLPGFSWESARDIDEGDEVTYTFIYSLYPDFSEFDDISHIVDTTYVSDTVFAWNVTYFWRVIATDGTVEVESESVRSFKLEELGVHLHTFSAEPDHGLIRLIWTYASDSNFFGFYLDRTDEHGNTDRLTSEPLIGSDRIEYMDRAVISGESYRYRLMEADLFGNIFEIGSTRVTVPFPETDRLWQNSPNPFRDRTKIRFVLSQPGRVDLKLYNAAGQHIKTLIHGEQTTRGERVLYWDGRNKNRERVRAGVYYYRLKSGSIDQTRRMVLIR